MPLFKSLDLETGTAVKIWKIEEPLEALMSPLDLKPESLERVRSMKSEIHARGFLSVRHLLRSLGYTDQDLFYDDWGKPHLRDGKYISITHSFNFSGLIIGDHPNGIDIEKQRAKITRIANKFIDFESDWMKFIPQDEVKSLTVIWCIKESLYKLYAKPGLSFKQHCMVIPFDLNDGETVSWIDMNGSKDRYDASFMEFEGFNCAYVEDL